MKGPALLSVCVLVALGLYLGGLCGDRRNCRGKSIRHIPGLDREITERRGDLLTLYRSLLGVPGMEETQQSSWRFPPQTEDKHGTLNCQHLGGLTGLGYVGSGFTKLVLKGTLPGGREIALKSVHSEGNDMTSCARRYGDPTGCYRLATYKLHKEVTLLHALRHPGVITLHGQCYENIIAPDFRVTAMLELGSPLEMIQLLQTPWEKRFKICLELVNLLHYLANSPLGSIALLDFQPRQFVLVNESLKVTDLDDATMEELPCRTDEDCALEFPSKTFAIQCSSSKKCIGVNEKRNLFNAYRFFFTYLLPYAAPPALQPFLLDIMNATGELRYGINETLEAFHKVLNLYKSGMNHRRKLLYLKDYMLIEGYRLNETNDDYRCWPSYNYRGCLLSMHSAEEAAEFCTKHTNCRRFVIGQEQTWTGRYIVSFTSNGNDLIPDVNSRVFVKIPDDSVSRSKKLRSS